MASKGLGRGLDALLMTDPSGAASAGAGGNGMLSLPLGSLVPNPNQPRKTMEDGKLGELAESIRLKGVLQPVLARPLPGGTWQIVAGERRWRAAAMAGLREIPVVSREMDDGEVLVAGLIENLQREDLNPAEEALALRELKDRLGLTQEELAARVGMSRSRVANSLRLLQLPGDGLERLRRGDITAGHARCLLAFADMPRQMAAFLDWIVGRKLSVRDAEDVVLGWKRRRVLPWIEGAGSRRPAPRLRDVEKALGEVLACRARVTGDGTAGKISLSYRSPEELERILGALGLQPAAPESTTLN